jgi:thioredoxin 1
MSNLTLEHHNRAELADLLSGDAWVVACLCAAWCDVCTQYRTNFEELASQHPDKHFVWIDIEDEADVVGDFDVENFPTLLIQRGDLVAFYGTVTPDARVAERLLMAQVEKNDAELAAEANSNVERQRWQEEYNLRTRLKEASGA